MGLLAARRVRELRPGVLALAWVLTVGCLVPGAGAARDGGRPNLDLPTLGGLQLWADVGWADGWRVQRHVWTRHHRLLDPSNVRRAWGSGQHCMALLERLRGERASGGQELVVLVHGLGRTRHSLRTLRETLERRGARVISFTYPSTRASLDEHAAGLSQLLAGLHDVERVSFVTHSLGGRVVLRLIEESGEWMHRMELGRVVQLAPPHGRSKLARWAQHVPPLAALLGPSLREVAEIRSNPPPAGVEVGVLAGVRGTPRGWNPLLPGDDDGILAASETLLDGMHEHATLRGVHTLLMNDARVLGATARFLAHGTFVRE